MALVKLAAFGAWKVLFIFGSESRFVGEEALGDTVVDGVTLAVIVAGKKPPRFFASACKRASSASSASFSALRYCICSLRYSSACRCISSIFRFCLRLRACLRLVASSSVFKWRNLANALIYSLCLRRLRK